MLWKNCTDSEIRAFAAKKIGIIIIMTTSKVVSKELSFLLLSLPWMLL